MPRKIGAPRGEGESRRSLASSPPEMTNVATVLRKEMQRLARAEVKALLTAEKKEVAELRKRVAAQDKQIARLATALKKRGANGARAPAVRRSVEPVVVDGLKWRSDSVRATRKLLGLTQREFADRVGVSQISVSFWETGRTTPRPKQQAKILALRSKFERRASAATTRKGAKRSAKKASTLSRRR